MKTLVKKFLSPLRKLIQYLFKPELGIDFWYLSPYKTSLVLLYQEKLMESSLNYALSNFRNCQHYYNLYDLWNYLIGHLKASGKLDKKYLFLEFGTWKGTSINYFSAKLPQATFYGFDSFEGLKEDWTGSSFAKGHFSLEGVLPKVNPNVTLIKGWFDETLPPFLKNKTENIGLLHIDCDTYESTKVVLDLVKNRIHPGTFILFDEYIGYASWEIGEYKAFQEFISSTGLKYKYLGFSNAAVLVQIL